VRSAGAPELISDFISNWETGSDVVWGVRSESVAAWMNWPPPRLAVHQIREHNTARAHPVLIDRIVVDEVVRRSENRNTLALIAAHFDQTQVYYDQQERVHGASRWTKRR
jgi:hypothetical protein